MTYAVTIDVHAPAAACQALHAQHLEPTGGQGDRLPVHLARPTAGGFQVLEAGTPRPATTVSTTPSSHPPPPKSASPRPAGPWRRDCRLRRAR